MERRANNNLSYSAMNAARSALALVIFPPEQKSLVVIRGLTHTQSLKWGLNKIKELWNKMVRDGNGQG
jgi:hypothetical protein